MDNLDSDLPGAEENASRGGIIGARGTAEGLIIRIDGRTEEQDLKRAISDFVSSRERFLSGHDVLIEWVGEKPVSELEGEIFQLLKSDFNITVKSSALKRAAVVKKHTIETAQVGGPVSAVRETISSDGFLDDSSAGYAAAEDFVARDDSAREEARGLFGGIEGIAEASQTMSRKGSVDGNLWDDPDARIIFSMLRSGQRIETEHSLVVFGDVNSGAELIAGGDIVVLGTLRGVAHAGAYEESGGGRTIFALNLQPTQLRIGSIISRGTGESKQKGPEVAHVDKDIIVVEPYAAKTFLSRKRDQ